ncbi:hypothetical protein [Brevundimonas subvibrioides]|uniref:hypothetical protein n=1 Tax=Brevundimonas subvibrioides TaxID=74313 RepID=UPI0022B44A81|nr:hypothetical protein [Brevundimonas subvibrioides]
MTAAEGAAEDEVRPTRRKIRPDSVWAEVRKAWESGETARSVARRYDVGVPALWKRREAEGWTRPEPQSGPVEPVEGWDSFAERKRERFLNDLESVRELALDLMRILKGGPIGDAPLWHLGFIYSERARLLGAEVAVADREKARGYAWGEVLWDAEGRLKPQWELDILILQLHARTWREEVGLPDGVAERWP